MILALIVAMHVAVVLALALGRPLPSRLKIEPVAEASRIQLVEVDAVAPPQAVLRPPRRVVREMSLPRRDPPRPARPETTGRDRAQADSVAVVAPDSDLPVRGARPAGAGASFLPPPVDGGALRNRVRTRLPGREDAIVEGFHVRERPSIEDRVLGVAALVFGGGRPETCDDVRQRLIGAGPGLARDMDVERLKRLCTQ